MNSLKQLLLFGFLFFFGCLPNEDIEPDFPKISEIELEIGANRLDFFVIGDWGWNGNKEQKEIADQMGLLAKKVCLDFIITTGDNFYSEGVKSIYDPLWKTNFETIYSDSSLNVPWYPTLGNHDYLGNPEAQVDYSITSDIWKMPARYYTFVKNINENIAIRFIAIDTEDFINQYKALDDTSEIEMIDQYNWLKNILHSTEETFVIVYGHHAIYSSGTTHGSNLILQKTIKPLLLSYGVELYFCGHDHHFEHAREKGENIDYFVVGAGGAIRDAEKNEQTIYILSLPGFLYVNISDASANYYFVTHKGELGYSYLKKQN